jgi:NADH-quinone oxidoreductase subunit I
MSIVRYFSDIFSVARSIMTGMGITIRYFYESLLFKKHTVTIQYPRERDVIPPRHRGLHFLETEKCIMCWKCADICPVDCIYIEGVRGADGPLAGGYRGTKCTLSKFTVDYTVCIFCGLCEEPCPPLCLHLGPEYDYHATDRRKMEKNLLTDAIYSDEDEKFVLWARGEGERLKAEKAKAAAAAKAEAAAKAAAAKAAVPSGTAAQGAAAGAAPASKAAPAPVTPPPPAGPAAPAAQAAPKEEGGTQP